MNWAYPTRRRSMGTDRGEDGIWVVRYVKYILLVHIAVPVGSSSGFNFTAAIYRGTIIGLT